MWQTLQKKRAYNYATEHIRSISWFSYDPVTKYVELPWGASNLISATSPANQVWTEVSYSQYIPSRLATRIRLGAYPLWDGATSTSYSYTGVALQIRSKGSLGSEYAGYTYHGVSYYTVDYPNYHDLSIINNQRSFEYFAQPLGTMGDIHFYFPGYYMR